ncbi:MAG TPA: SHOCT domain-containing protein [Phenylobacterium sp.]|nr:SHOCT domain-containing protein [Phenylobacterium sp.]
MTDVIEHSGTAQAAAATGGGGPIWDQLQTLLVAGESVRAWALQHRIYALAHRRQVAAATSGRFIFMTRPILGGYDPVTIRWQDLRDARLQVGMVSAALTIGYSANLSDTAGGEGGERSLRVAGLEIGPAQALYRECQAQEQSWREKRRVRSIEEMRAQSGGVQIATGVYPQGGGVGPDRVIDPPGAAGREDDPAQRLARAREMLRDGLISDAEYEAIKARIVGAL